MYPQAIFINCGITMCNILNEYCRFNQICASCNEHICNLKEHKDEFPLQCYFYCEKVGDKLKPLNDKGLAFEFGEPGLVALVVVICVLFIVCIGLCVALYRKSNNSQATGKVEYRKINVDVKNENKNGNKTGNNTRGSIDFNISSNKNAGENQSKRTTDNRSIHGSDSAFSTDGSSDFSICEDLLPGRTKNKRFVKGTVPPQNDRLPGNEGQNQNKLVTNYGDSEVMSQYQ